MKFRIKLLAIFLLSFVSIFIVVNFVFSGINYSKASGEIDVVNNGVEVYIAGEFVMYNEETKKYYVTEDCTVTAMIINDYKIATTDTNGVLATVNNGSSSLTFDTQVFTFDVGVDDEIDIDVYSRAITPSDYGKALSMPYFISSSSDFLALHRILGGTGTAEDRSIFNDDTVDDLQIGYFRLSDNIVLDTNEFYGIENFRGVLDFNGYNFTLNATNRNYSFGTSAETLNVGLFSTLENSTTLPCVIKDGNLKGSIALEGNNSAIHTINAGGFAGLTKGNVMIDNLTSSMSISVEDNTNINLGGFIGVCETPIESYSALIFNGVHSTIKAITNGYEANSRVGSFAAIANDVYIHGYRDESYQTVIISNTLNGDAGVCIAGGFIGEYNLSSGLVKNMKDISMVIRSGMSISTTVNNSNANTDKQAISGGIFGKINSNGYLYIDPICFIKPDYQSYLSNIEVVARNQASTSRGAVYAGGLIGYVSGSGVYLSSENTDPITIFEANVKIKAEQNGYCKCFAGGVFGYFAGNFLSDKLIINLNSPDSTFEVEAVQSSTSRVYQYYEGTILITASQEVCAGFYSSVLQEGFAIDDLEFNVYNATATAKRSVGSTAVGAIYAGGFAGMAIGDGTTASHLKNIVTNYYETSINALCLSYESNSVNYKGYDNNLACGGFLGYAYNLGAYNSYYGIEDIVVNVYVDEQDDYFIYGIQNAVSGSSDNQTEGYCGGVIGYLRNTQLKNINLLSLEERALIYLNCTNSPNTAACGGLIGENYVYQSFTLDGGSVNNVRVLIDAYTDLDGGSNTYYDVYAGGAIGVLGSGGSYTMTMKNVFVSETYVETNGENLMYTYAGGIVGGMWWSGTLTLENCEFYQGTVRSTSLAYYAYAGGITGLIQGTVTINKCANLSSYIYAYSNKQDVYVSGMIAQVKNGTTSLTNCYSDAELSGYCGTSKSIYLDPVCSTGTISSTSNNYYDLFASGEVSDGDTFSPSSSAYNYNYLSLYTDNDLQYSYLQLSSGETALVYNRYNASYMSISFTGDTSLATFSDNQITVNSDVGSGTIFAEIWIEYSTSHSTDVVATAEDTTFTYKLCSYPIYINGGTQVDYSVRNLANYSEIIDSSSYIEDDNTINYVYRRFKLNSEDIQNFLITFTGTLPDYDLYNPAVSSYTDEEEVVRDIIGRCQTSVVTSEFNNKIGIRFYQKSIAIYPFINLLSERTVIVFKFSDSDYVIFDYIPNYVKAIDIEASSDTPALGSTEIDGQLYYQFATGDIINFDAYEIKDNDSRLHTAFVSYEFTIPSGYESYIETAPNGTIKISSDSAIVGQTIIVKAAYDGIMEEFDDDVADVYYYILIEQQLSHSANLVGTSFDSDRKAVSGVEFSFTIQPSSGYGLNPEKVIITIGDNVFDLTEQLQWSASKNITSSIIITIDDVDYEFKYNFYVATDGYDIIIPANAVVDDIVIDVEYDIVCDIVFDRGATYSLGGNERYYIYQVKAGTELTEELYHKINGEDNVLEVSRYGYILQGYYLTDIATTIASYGDPLYDQSGAGKDICNYATPKVINGPIYFYARWTYMLVTECPDGITIESALPLGLLGTTEAGNVTLVPIDTQNGFKFKIIKEDSFEGIPSFAVYVKNDSDEFIDITEYCEELTSGGYTVDPYAITGVLFIKVFTESVVFNDGESESDVSSDVNIYSDSIFTINYSINYSSTGVSVDASAGASDLIFKFNNELPSGTSLRLYRHINGSALDSFSMVLTTSANDINIYDFVSMYNQDALTKPNISTIFSEKYYLIVTLPNHTNYLSLDNNYVIVEKDFDESALTNINIEYTGITADEFGTLRPNYLDSGYNKISFTVYEAVEVSAVLIGATLTPTIGSEKVIDSTTIEDLRHRNKYYVWEVYNANGLSADDITNIDAIFGADKRIVTTNTAVYYLVESEVQLNDSVSGLVISMLEVSEVKAPASGILIARFEYSS